MCLFVESEFFGGNEIEHMNNGSNNKESDRAKNTYRERKRKNRNVDKLETIAEFLISKTQWPTSASTSCPFVQIDSKEKSQDESCNASGHECEQSTNVYVCLCVRARLFVFVGLSIVLSEIKYIFASEKLELLCSFVRRVPFD